MSFCPVVHGTFFDFCICILISSFGGQQCCDAFIFYKMKLGVPFWLCFTEIARQFEIFPKMKRYIEKEYFFHWFDSIGFLVLKKVQSSAIMNKIHEFVDHDALGLHWGDIKGYLENISSNPSEWSYSDKDFQKYIEGFTVNCSNCVSIGATILNTPTRVIFRKIFSVKHNIKTQHLYGTLSWYIFVFSCEWLNRPHLQRGG